MKNKEVIKALEDFLKTDDYYTEKFHYAISKAIKAMSFMERVEGISEEDIAKIICGEFAS